MTVYAIDFIRFLSSSGLKARRVWYKVGPMKPKLEMIYPLRISAADYDRIRSIAEHEDRTAASVIRLALKGYLKKCSRREHRGGGGETANASAE
jgi:hypothetical protein